MHCRSFGSTQHRCIALLAPRSRGYALAVLALLSSGPTRLLNMNMTSTDGTRVSQAEFIEKLSDWWRDKKMSDEDWRRWASTVDVKWVPVALHEATS
jgi:hypothetical protein